MLIRDFLNSLLDDTLEDARHRHLLQPTERMGWLGACRAIEECRECMLGLNMSRALGRLLAQARSASADSLESMDPQQWYWFSREATVEWVASVVSVVLLHEHLPVIVEPTWGAGVEAARLVGLVSPS